MCLAVPGQIKNISGKNAEVDFGGVTRNANISFIDEVKVGDFVLVHVGFAIEKVDETKARELYSLLYEGEELVV